MSLLIKGMSMPKSCEECPCREYPEFSFESDWCCLNKKTISDVKVISPNCPFIEIPTPHGRLIDAGTVEKRLQKYWYEEYPNQEASYHRAFMDSNACVKDLPTIIEAEVTSDGEVR